jgi:hypothetical protein
MTIEVKNYSNASNARRAAKAAGLSEFDVYKVSEGRYKIREAATRAAMAAKAAQATKAPKKICAKVRNEPMEPKEQRATKGNKLIDMIKEGATITELTASLGWQKHTVRAALCRLNKAGYTVVRTKVGTAEDGFESHYKIAA